MVIIAMMFHHSKWIALRCKIYNVCTSVNAVPGFWTRFGFKIFEMFASCNPLQIQSSFQTFWVQKIWTDRTAGLTRLKRESLKTAEIVVEIVPNDFRIRASEIKSVLKVFQIKGVRARLSGNVEDGHQRWLERFGSLRLLAQKFFKSKRRQIRRN